jgi:hypothetical protein
MIGEYTDTEYVSAEITEEGSIETKSKAEFKPEVKVSEKLTISVFSAGGGKKKTTTRKSKFSGRKGGVSVTKLGSSVVWDGLKGLNESAIGQSLAENINLWATCEWPKKKGSGSVGLRAFYDFFSADGEKLSKIKPLFAGIVAGLKPDVLETEKTRVLFRAASGENS